MVAYTYKLPVGIPGNVVRTGVGETLEPNFIDRTTPPTRYGDPVKLVSGYVQPLAEGDGAGDVYGFLVRPFPTQSAPNVSVAGGDALGVSVPVADGVCTVLRRGYINVKLYGDTAASVGSQVYVRTGGADADQPIGGLEAAADGDNTVALPGVAFTGAADAGDITEVSVQIAPAAGALAAALAANKRFLNVNVANLAGGTASVYRIKPGYAGSLTKLHSVLAAAIAAGDATITAAISGDAVTGGVITITQSGSAAGDEDVATPTAANVFTADDVIELTVGGTSTSTTGAMVTLETTS